MSPLRYPENQSPFLAALPERHRRFAELREEYLLGYCYNTARAYWGDLEDLFDWAEAEGLDVLELREDQIAKYLTEMIESGYSLSTVRRRRTAFRGFAKSITVSIANGYTCTTASA